MRKSEEKRGREKKSEEERGRGRKREKEVRNIQEELKREQETNTLEKDIKKCNEEVITKLKEVVDIIQCENGKILHELQYIKKTLS